MAKIVLLGKKKNSRQKPIFARQKKYLLGSKNEEKVPSFGLIKAHQLICLFQMILKLKYRFLKQ
jgi:hypothetical protein